ncbi:MAG: hypothetical protein AAGA77_03770 [Bacteroidota bacterium]
MDCLYKELNGTPYIGYWSSDEKIIETLREVCHKSFRMEDGTSLEIQAHRFGY